MADTEIVTPVVAEEAKPEVKKVEETTEEVKKEEENGKHESDVQLDEKLKMKILGQLEYYFGDVNLPRDTFMKGEMAKNEGWIEIGTMLKFNRLKTILDALEESKQIPAMLESIQGSDLIEVDSTGTKLRRNPEMPPPESKAEDKTVYLKGFNKTETTLDELLEHFKNTYEGVQGIIMRNFNRKTFENAEVVFKREFKGSIFVVFKTKEQAEAVLKEESTKYRGVELIKMMQKDHSAQKLARFQARIEARKKKEQDDNEKPSEPENVIPELPENIFVKVLAIPEGLSREDIKFSWAEHFASLDKKDEFQISFIDFNRGEKDAILRLEKENAADEAIELLSKGENAGKVPIGSAKRDKTPCEVVKMEGEEEKKHREKVVEEQKLKLNQRKRQAGGRGRGRGHKRQRRY